MLVKIVNQILSFELNQSNRYGTIALQIAPSKKAKQNTVMDCFLKTGSIISYFSDN